MEIVILHGTGLAAIANKLFLIKKGFESLSIQEISGKELDFEKIKASFSTPGLFSQKRLVVLEDVQKVDLEQISADDNLTLVLKYQKTLTAKDPLLAQAAKFNAQIINLEERDETSIFPFLDNLAEKKSLAIEQFEKYYSEWGGQYVLTMIFYMLRRMVTSSKKLPPFVQKKIEMQKRNFSVEKIKELYKEGLEADYKIKSGLADERVALTLFVTKILV